MNFLKGYCERSEVLRIGDSLGYGGLGTPRNEVSIPLGGLDHAKNSLWMGPNIALLTVAYLISFGEPQFRISL